MPLLLPIWTYSSRQVYRISCVPSVTMKGCSLNFATKKPLKQPTAAPMSIASRITTMMGSVPISGHILLARLAAFCSRDAEMQAVRPTTRPADRSVPVSTIQPAMPSAAGRYAAVWERMLMRDAGLIKLGFLMAI